MIYWMISLLLLAGVGLAIYEKITNKTVLKHDFNLLKGRETGADFWLKIIRPELLWHTPVGLLLVVLLILIWPLLS